MRTPGTSATPELPDSHWSYGFLIPHDPRAASVVRAALRAILRATRLGCVADTVVLLASELITNAYRHSPSDAQRRAHTGRPHRHGLGPLRRPPCPR